MPFPTCCNGAETLVSDVYAMCSGSVCVKFFRAAALHRWMQNAAQVAGEQRPAGSGCPFGLKPEERIYPTQVLFPLVSFAKADDQRAA